jgi:glycosyltransferase involved in cell wall biosynthesis
VHNLLLVKPECILAAKLLGKKVVWFFHDWWLLCARRNLFSNGKSCLSSELKPCNKCIGIKEKVVMLINKFLINLCNAGNASTSFARKVLEKNSVLRGKFFVTRPWVNPIFFSVKRKTPEKTIIFVGSLEDYKGAFVAAKAMKNVLKKMPKAKLLFVGSGQEGNKRKEIEEIGIADGTLRHFVFLGKKNHKELLKIYKEAGCLVCPSVWPEPTGTTWMEAGAAGVPVIASKVGGIPEIFPNKKFLFKPRDHEELAKKILAAIGSKQDSGLFKERFYLEKNTMEIITKYKELLHH